MFPTTRMVANRHMLLLGAAPGREWAQFTLNFADEASRHNIPVRLDLAAMDNHCMLCGDRGQLWPYSHI